ncbi:MAG: hypothetical protein IJH12_02780 [Clostridia bacterium]|nr:hypothetical protein [Clostridia bacterium]
MKKSKISIIFAVIIFALSLLQKNVYAYTATIEYGGSVTYGYSTVGNFFVDGRRAFCMDHDKTSPSSGTEAESEPFSNEDVVKCLYYGYEGREQWSGFESEEHGIVVTTLALDHYVHGSNKTVARDFINYVDSMPMPEITLGFENDTLVATRDGNIQKTNSTRVTGNSGYSMTINLPANVTLVNETRGTRNTGSSDVYGGDTFHLEAPLSVTGNWTSDAITNRKYRFNTIMYKTSSDSLQNLVGDLTIYVDPTSQINLNARWLSLGELEVYKKDSVTGGGVGNTTFELRAENGEVVKTFTTDEKGYAKVSELTPANYTIVEVKANENYYLDETARPVSITAGNTSTISIDNKHKEGNLKLYKIDKDNNKQALGDVEFDLYSKEFDRVVGTYRTNVNGEISVENLRTGNYIWQEKTTNKWYNLAKDTEVTVIADKTTESKIQNELKKGQIKIIKVDKDNNEVKLEGVTFDVLDENGNVLETLTTDKNGEAKTSKYAVRDYSQLVLKETSTNKYYKLNDNTETIELKANEITTIKFENELKKGKIRIIKVDKDNNEVKLEGVTFEVLNEQGKVIQTLVTDENGEVTSIDLPINEKYTIRETQTLENYDLTKDTQTITLTEDQITSIKFENEKKKGQIKIIKTDGETTYPLKDIAFEITNSKGEVVDIVVTDEKGEAITKRLPIDERYTIRETKTQKGYILTEDSQTIELKENEITELKFDNYKGRGQIKIVKTSSDGRAEGFSFKVYGTSYTGEYFEGIFKTDENGQILIENVLEGNYTIEEIRDEISSSYEELPSQNAEVKNGETTEVSFHNKLIEVPKTGDNSHITKFAGAIFFAILGVIYLVIKIFKGKNKE